MALNPQQIAEKYQRRASQAGRDWEAGIQGVTQSPGQAAAAQADKWLNNTMAAQSKWVQNVSSVTLAQWKERAMAVGATRYNQGVAAGAQKYADYMRRAAPVIDQIKAEVDAMPSATFEDNIARMVKNAELMRGLSNR